MITRGGRRRTPLFGADDRGLAIDLVLTHTEDNQKWDGMIFKPGGDADPRRKRLAVLVVHGSVGNYLTGVPRRVSFGLAQAGFTVLSVNPRMANYGVIFGGGLMHRTPLDIDAALAVLRRRGFRRIVLLGFSQGACLSLEYAARNPRRYGAVLALSGGLIGETIAAGDYAGSLDGTPVFLGCSDVDPFVPLARVQETAAIMEDLGGAVTLRIYPNAAHTIVNDEIDHIRAILDKMLAQ